MVKEKTVEKAMKAIVGYYDLGTGGFIRADYLVTHAGFKEAEVAPIIDHLKARGLVTFESSHKGEPEELRLTDAGRCFLTNRAVDKKRERKAAIREWFAIIISLIALVRSFWPNITEIVIRLGP